MDCSGWNVWQLVTLYGTIYESISTSQMEWILRGLQLSMCTSLSIHGLVCIWKIVISHSVLFIVVIQKAYRWKRIDHCVFSEARCTTQLFLIILKWFVGNLNSMKRFIISYISLCITTQSELAQQKFITAFWPRKEKIQSIIFLSNK